VFAGGGYTVGAWKTVFKDVANDVAEDLRAQIESLGYVVQPKTLPGKAEESPVAAFSPAKVDPTEPWTGKWRVVEGHHTLKGLWAMKQSGTIVKSTNESYYELKGKVRGNQLEGKLAGDYNLTFNFVITLSTDGQSFKGATKGPGAGIIRGIRE
jgi:hypothetical protein